ncbi:MAG: LysE family transporter [Peptococcaceae bacterium]|nr:LysE family transporter [Peptococcaceae bacterium]
MDLAAVFTTSFLVAFSGAMMPGPLLVVTVKESMKKGFWAGPVIIAGHALLELVLVAMLMLGAATLLSGEAVNRAIGFVGGVFLLFLGGNMVRDIYIKKHTLFLDGSLRNNVTERVSLKEWLKPAGAGIVYSLANPYWSIWWATVGLLYITQTIQSTYWGVPYFFTGHILADLVWYSLVSAMVAGGRNFISQKLYNGILFLCGIFIVLLGAYFIRGAIGNII